MIYDILPHIQQYQGLHPGILKGLRFLVETDLSGLEDQRIELDGDDLFALIQNYETKPVNDRPEAHRDYVDIQYLIQGNELIGVAPLEEMEEEMEARPEGDIWFYRGPVENLPIGAGRFMVLFPGDAHAPCIAVDGKSSPVKKCVVKVRIAP